MTTSAFTLAKYFINHGLDQPENRFDGNMKLQKLLYFSQLTHLVLHREQIFNEDIYAFENGCVVEDVRKEYYENYYRFAPPAREAEPLLNGAELETVQLVERMFGHLPAKELSDLNHEQETWKSVYHNSIQPNGYRNKESALLDFANMDAIDLEGFSEMIEAFQESEEDRKNKEVINGVQFFYDPEEILMNEETIKQLEQQHWDEEAYTIYKDETQGLVVF